MKKVIITTIAIAILLPAGIVLAQPGFGGPPPPPPPPNRERFQQMQMWKLTETLDLTDDQAAKFFPLFNSFQKEVDKIRDENDDLFEKLDAYIKTEDKGKIAGVIDQIDKNESKILDSRKKFRLDAAKVLTEVQIGKLVHFQHEFPRRFRDAIWDCRDGGPDKGQRQKDNRPGRSEAPRMGAGHEKGYGWHMGNPDCPNR